MVTGKLFACTVLILAMPLGVQSRDETNETIYSEISSLI
jgi:hypothetical protein